MDAKGGPDDRYSGSPVAESKGEGKDDDDDPKGSGGQARETRLLRIVAQEAEEKLFGGDSELMVFVSEHAEEWAEAVTGEQDGSGSPIKKMGLYRQLHGDYLAIMERWLEQILSEQRATLEEFMEEVKTVVSRDEAMSIGPRDRDRYGLVTCEICPC